MTPEQKKRRFRELAKHDRIFTARELLADLEQPFLPLINDIVTGVEKYNARPKKGVFRENRQKSGRTRMPVHAFFLRGRYDDIP